MDPSATICRCACGEGKFQLRIRGDEQVALLTCESGHHSLLLDSRDYWMDVIQEGRPRPATCTCKSRLFQIGLIYSFRNSGDVRTIDILIRCTACSRDLPPRQWEFKYGPTDELVTRPLDPIDLPWLRPKRIQITAYWLPADAQRFVEFLVHSLGARVFQQIKFTEFIPISIDDIQFLPELRCDLYFTNTPGIAPPLVREPHKSAPVLHLSSPFHMMWSCRPGASLQESASLLHYFEYAEEVLASMHRVKQPPEFLAFARAAREWLVRNFISFRGKNSADNPQEYERAFAGRSKRAGDHS